MLKIPVSLRSRHPEHDVTCRIITVGSVCHVIRFEEAFYVISNVSCSLWHRYNFEWDWLREIDVVSLFSSSYNWNEFISTDSVCMCGRERARGEGKERERELVVYCKVWDFFFLLILFHIMGLVLWRRNGTEKDTLLLFIIEFVQIQIETTKL